MTELITIVGPTGIGKTTLVRTLAKAGHFATGFETHQERPFQALFKQDVRYALANQVDYLLYRAEQERALRLAPEIGIIDGGLDLDFHGFTRLFHNHGLLTHPEYDLCRRVYSFARVALPLPELIIRLSAPRETVASRLSGRERINIATMDDFDLLESYLDEWLASIDPAHVIQFEVSAHAAEYSQTLPGLLSEIRTRLRPNSMTV